jgi:hypothetical protein
LNFSSALKTLYSTSRPTKGMGAMRRPMLYSMPVAEYSAVYESDAVTPWTVMLSLSVSLYEPII